jgi:hypothetical protein
MFDVKNVLYRFIGTARLVFMKYILKFNNPNMQQFTRTDNKLRAMAVFAGKTSTQLSDIGADFRVQRLCKFAHIGGVLRSRLFGYEFLLIRDQVRVSHAGPDFRFRRLGKSIGIRICTGVAVSLT